jgi:hypothetical protein
MPLAPYVGQLELPDEAVIWRFMPIDRFRDLVTSQELYFRRADLFGDDKNEGVPPEEYVAAVFGLNLYDLNDRQALNGHLGNLAQFRESCYVSCWYHLEEEPLRMWERFAPEGIAVCSRYGLLKAAMDAVLDMTHLGQIRYGTRHLGGGYNTMQFITTKRTQYEDEREVRAFFNVYDPVAGGNRHIDINDRRHPASLPEYPVNPWVPDCKRRRIDLKALITGFVVSPWASEEVLGDVRIWVNVTGHSCPVERSKLASPLTPTLEQLRAIRGR